MQGVIDIYKHLAITLDNDDASRLLTHIRNAVSGVTRMVLSVGASVTSRKPQFVQVRFDCLHTTHTGKTPGGLGKLPTVGGWK